MGGRLFAFFGHDAGGVEAQQYTFIYGLSYSHFRFSPWLRAVYKYEVEPLCLGNLLLLFSR